jgi:nucleotide-binding universal stress UspA family protein
MCNLRRILVAVDFSDTSASVLDFGRTLADACGASLHVLHVIGHRLTTAEAFEQERTRALARLDALLDRADREQRNVTISCTLGTPAAAIVDYATNHLVDLIVMGTHWHDPAVPVTVGSIAGLVLADAPCALLAVKAPRSEGQGRVVDSGHVTRTADIAHLEEPWPSTKSSR